MPERKLVTKKSCLVRKSILIFGEGIHEEMFLKHLRATFHKRSDILSLQIKGGHGGSPETVVTDAAKVIGDYHKRIVVYDNDKSVREMEKADDIARRINLCVIKNKPCLEALLLRILNPTTDFTNKPTYWLKSEFESKYMPAKKRLIISEYARLFPEQLLRVSATTIAELSQLIEIVKTGNY